MTKWLLSSFQMRNTDNEIAERLVGVVSIALYSVEIPYSWYTFAAAKGTTCAQRSRHEG